jgi:hypothetical protein
MKRRHMRLNMSIDTDPQQQAAALPLYVGGPVIFTLGFTRNPMPGLFSSTSPDWLIEKLEADLQALRTRPRDPMTAFNFFVTAETLVDWLLPGNANRQARKVLRDQELILQVVSHIASEAKHFVAEAAHHKTVKSTRRTGGVFSGGLFASRLFAGHLFPKGEMIVELDGDAAAKYGLQIGALALAELVIVKLNSLVGERRQ